MFTFNSAKIKDVACSVDYMSVLSMTKIPINAMTNRAPKKQKRN